jgi:hypothetical protein
MIERVFVVVAVSLSGVEGIKEKSCSQIKESNLHWNFGENPQLSEAIRCLGILSIIAS